MQFSEQWLRQWVNPAVDTQQLAEALTMLGLEVDAVQAVAELFSQVVVGQVIHCVAHPNADRLRFCHVDIGQGEHCEVVCGAPNVRIGLKVAFAKIGGILPGHFTIKKARLRGVDSYGMICSAKELGLSEEHEGIMELPVDAPVGVDFREYLALDDHIIDVALTPNRGDCASICGVARELAAQFQLPLSEPEIKPVIVYQHQLPISVVAAAQCPRYVGRVIRGIRTDVTTPWWMREQLRRGGLRTVHPVVDITNYVMLELGQPLHAFDCEQLAGKITVRLTTAGERVHLLDGQSVTLQAGTLVIADAQQIQAVAGVMGSINSAVTATTQNIFVESAFFAADAVTQAARQLGVITDASYRFERGVDYLLQVKALERFTQLLQDICGGEAGPINAITAEAHLPQVKVIPLRYAQIERILGTTIAHTQVVEILQRLGMQVAPTADGWSVMPPSYRFDIALEVDLIEELARLIGYQHIPPAAMVGELKTALSSIAITAQLRLQHLLSDMGYHEAITYSFVDPKIQRLFDAKSEFLALANPLTADMSVMRTSLWPGLVQALRYNVNRQHPRVRLFEIGLCFITKQALDVSSEVFIAADDSLQQINKLAGLIAGDVHDLQWSHKSRPVDFFDCKAEVVRLFAVTQRDQVLSWRPSQHVALHPGQAADIYWQDMCIGHVGALHPNIVRALDLSTTPFVFELDMSNLVIDKARHYKNISKFPTVRRDLAIVIDNQVSAETIQDNIKKYAGHLLFEVKIFDIYQGEGIESGKKSVALSLTFQDSGRTLVDEDIHEITTGVVNGLQRDLNAILRA